MRRIGVAVFVGMAAQAAPLEAADPPGTIKPAAPRIERAHGGDVLNFDILVTAPPSGPATIGVVEVSYLDDQGRTLYRRELDFNGRGLETLPNRDLPAGGMRLVYNPFPRLPPDVSPVRVRTRVTLFELPANGDPATWRIGQVQEATATLSPSNEQPLHFPLRGRVRVWDGHDLTSHHRRFDYTQDGLRNLGFVTNSARYAYDFAPVDAEERMTVGTGDANEAYIGFGRPVYAPDAGAVVEAQGDQPDDRRINVEAVKRNPNASFGNYVIRDHGDGRVSLLGHLRQGSVSVKVGDQIEAGAQIGAVGASGSSLFPHLHYQLMDGQQSATAEGLPSYFKGLLRVRGVHKHSVIGVSVDSGDVLIARSPSGLEVKD